MSALAVCMLVLVILFILGMPIFMSLAIAAIAALLAMDGALPLSVVPNSLFDGVNLFPLLAIP